jgi:Flp pilus assembly pilin Flp
MTYKNEKAQGIVEYALILAFIVGVAVALFNSGGLADAIGKAFYEVSETINNAIDNSPEAKQERMRNTLEDGLKDAIRHSRITLGVGDWVEIDAQEELNSDPQINLIRQKSSTS